MIIRLNHVTIRTAHPERMKKFYSEILSMEKDRRRPDHFAGFHLRSMTSSGEPLIHVMTGEDAQINDGTIPIERGGAVQKCECRQCSCHCSKYIFIRIHRHVCGLIVLLNTIKVVRRKYQRIQT